MLTTVIADENPQARAPLGRLLGLQNVQVLAEADNGLQTLQLIEEMRPSLLFMDTKLSGLNGIQAAGALKHMEYGPLLIFVTDCADHAVAAFEHDALDYLVKPVTPERLAKTLLRARQRLHTAAPAPVSTTAQLSVPTTQQCTERNGSGTPLRRLPIRENYAVRLLRVEEIMCVLSREKRSYVRTSAGEFRTSYTLTQLETLLPLERFQRIHDSCIVNLELVDEVLFMGNHSYAVQLSNGLELPIGRTRFGEVQRRLGMVHINVS